ncbi:MAG: glycosyltransferase family 2 protein [Candidatus Berkelbacteria bacterium]|nr:glycosyltransferase family 2 protein [Candidatus Berkelbacteria bacterium]
MTKKVISLVFPVHNESAIIEDSVNRLLNYCKKQGIKSEIIIAENGSSDNTKEILKQLKQPELKAIFLKKRGLGNAYRAGIKAATYPVVYFSGVDLPFGCKDIMNCYRKIEECDFIVGSKAHSKSKVEVSFKRRISSSFLRLLLRVFLGLKTRDPQGSAMFKREKVIKLLRFCDSDDAFFQSQLVLQSERHGLKVVEIPVKYISPRKGSKMRIKDGLRMARQIMAERKKLRNQK